MANTLLAKKSSKDVPTTCLDDITLGTTANYDLNLRRREAMRPQFKPEFGKGLCGSTSPADEFLLDRENFLEVIFSLVIRPV